MLIGESGYPQAVCLRALGNARPIHVHRDVRVSDLFKWRIKASMARADLNVSLKFGARTPVIDRDYIPAWQVRCDIVEPVERGLIERPFIPRQPGGSRSLAKRTLDEHKLVAFQIDKLFHVAADQAHRHRIQ